MTRRSLSITLLCATLVHLSSLDVRAANVLFVTNNNGSLTAQETLRRTQFQTWGHTVNTIWDGASQATYNAAFVVNDVVYVSEEASVGDLSYKLRLALIGVVNEDRSLPVELGFSSSDGSTISRRRINVTNNTHEITSSFPTGSLTILTARQNLVYLGGSTASGGQTLATVNGASALFVIDTGGTLANTYSGNSTAAGRRVQLPFGGDDFDFSRLTANGLTLLQNALEWAAAGSDAPVLAGHWKLNETSGTTAHDSSTFAEHGTVYGTRHWSTRCSGVGAFDFDGSANYISIANAPNLRPTSALTVAAWIKGDAWGSGADVDAVLRKGEGNPNNFQLAIADGRVTLYLDDSDTGGIRGNTVLVPGRWYHVAAVWDGATVSIYVNGHLDATPAARTGTIGTDTRALYIGGRAGADCFDGMVYDVRLYNYALESSEITELYGLVGHWKLDEASGTSAADSSGLGRNGTVVGTATWTDGRIDGALSLNGSTYVQIPGKMGSPANISISVWADLTSPDNSGAEIVSIGDYFAIRLDGNPSSYAFFYRGSDWVNLYFSRDSGQGFAGSGWHHFAAVFNDDQNSFKVYVDGEEAASATRNESIVYTGLGSNTYIGRHGNGETWYDFNGKIDDVRIYSRALCPEEIEDIYGEGIFPGVRIIKWVEIQ